MADDITIQKPTTDAEFLPQLRSTGLENSNPNWTHEKWQEVFRKLDSETEFQSKFLGEWPVNDAVYTREEVEKKLLGGEITTESAERMLRMRYRVNSKGEKIVEEEKF